MLHAIDVAELHKSMSLPDSLINKLKKIIINQAILNFDKIDWKTLKLTK